MYPVSNDFINKTLTKTEEIFEKISPYYGEGKSDGMFFIDEDGHLCTTDPFVCLLGSIGEVIDDLSKTQYEEIMKETKENIGEIIQQKTNKLIEEKTKEQSTELIEIKTELQKIERLLKYAIPDLENLIECPLCKEYNPPDKKFCINCNGQINEVVVKIKRKREKEDER
jgi:hypothetical protein